jgi:spermidine synthase
VKPSLSYRQLLSKIFPAKDPLSQPSEVSYRIGVGIVSFSLVALQVGLTRIFSNMVWYHLTFLTISLAMLGFSLGGLILFFYPRLASVGQQKTVPVCASLFALFIALGIIYIFYAKQIHGFLLFAASFSADGTVTPTGIRFGVLGFLGLFFLIFVFCFGFSGLTIATAITQKAKDIGKVYFANLLGSGIGCFGIIVALSQLGAFRSMLMILACCAVAPFCFGGAKTLPRFLYWTNIGLLFGSVLLLVFVDKNTIFVHSILTRSDVQPERRIYREWNSFSVVDFYKPLGQDEVSTYEGLWGLSKKYKGERPEPIKVIIDSWAVTSINRVDGHTIDSPIYDYLPANIPYSIIEEPTVLIMGAGGGIDVLSALHYKAKRIKAVEINPSIVRAVKEVFADFAGNIYNHPKVDAIAAEGRHIINRDRNQYDLIQLSGVDTLSGAQASSFSFSESYLYTRDAFDEYLKHLEPDGVLSFLRFAFKPPREILRLMTTATESLERLGVADPSHHLIAIHSNRFVFANLMVKKNPFTRTEIRKIEQLVNRMGFSFLYRPDQKLNHAYELFRAAYDRERFYHTYPFRVRPVTDDDPFFFNYTKLESVFSRGSFDSYWLYWIGQTILFYGAVFISALILLFIGLPYVWQLRLKSSVKGKNRFVGYFLSLGVAFMFIEIMLMQRFTLFLGQPIYALTLVLFCLLVFAGLGSRISDRIKDDAPKLLIRCFVLLLVTLLLTFFLTDWLFDALLHHSLALRIVVSVVLLAGPSFLMGFPFPLVVRLAHRYCPEMIPWGWAINGYGGVLGSFLSVITAMFLGFTAVYSIALLLYALAGLFLVSLRIQLGNMVTDTSQPPGDSIAL